VSIRNIRDNPWPFFVSYRSAFAIRPSSRTIPAMSPDRNEQAARVVEEYRRFLSDAVARLCPRDLGLEFDDIVQEASLRLLRAIESEREIRDLASYVYRIAATTTIDAIRRARSRREEQLRHEGADDDDDRGPHVLPTAPGLSPERLAERNELARAIAAAVDALPENRRRAVGLHLEGFTTQEIGEMTGWTEPKARNLVYRGLEDVRATLTAGGITIGRQ
jgi:RNA polymerase sigma factor (sigma-70 family)